MSEDKLTQEQAALLAHVAQTESKINSGVIPHDDQGNPIEPEPSMEDAASENAAILGVVVDMLTPVMPFMPDCYTPDTIKRIAGAYTAVEQKYGWNARQHLGVEVQLAIVAVPPTIAAILMGRAYFKAKAEREEQKQVEDGSE